MDGRLTKITLKQFSKAKYYRLVPTLGKIISNTIRKSKFLEKIDFFMNGDKIKRKRIFETKITGCPVHQAGFKGAY